MLVPEDKLRIKFYTVTIKKHRKKLVAIFELILESLIYSKHINLQEGNLSDPKKYPMKSTVKLKLYYTPPNIDQERASLGAIGDEGEIIDCNMTFDDESQYIRSKSDSGV